MFTNRSEAHGRVLEAIDDIKACCEISDHYMQWCDIAASSIQTFLEDLSAEQVDDTCGAFREYISETVEENPNLSAGVKEALSICLNEMLDYIGDTPDYDESNEDDYYSDYDRETAYLVSVIKSEIKRLNEINCSNYIQ